ncbi:mucin-5AC-like isoform X2 [Acropora millepora]|uniref:mucin-5AC-like isoform X2 n=1 Tax=Acropora millepora TaxID=45264 RepID=UPI001CF299A3|nr:mucin-5AC-like isoform X2 [Acropora millepora]
MSLWKTVLLFLTFVCMLEESGKSSSIVETSSPQTSILLQTEPTSSSISVVKTADLGISGTEYRETTSPATVYHSPSNWLVTTPSSTAESDTVTPMLAPSTTTGKHKTSLHPSNTMLIKKSTSTDLRLESTDYKLSGQITSSYKTESQQTRAVQVPEMISYSKATKSLKLSTSSKSSPSFPTSSPSALSSSLLSLPTSFLLSHRGTTETTLLTKSTYSSMTPVRISSNAEQAAMTNSTVVTPNSRTERPTSSDLPRMKSSLPVSTVVSSTPISPSTRRKLQIKETLSISTSRSQVSSSLSSTSSKSSPSFPTSSLSVPLSSFLSLPTSSLLSHRGTTETTLLTKSTYSSMTPVRISSNAEQAAMTNSTVVTSNSRTERPTSSDLPRMKSNLLVSTVVSSTPISPSTRRKLQIKVTLSISTSRSQVSSSLSSTSSKSSLSFPTSSLSAPLSSLLSTPTSSLLSHRETTETTLLTKSTHSSMTPVRISSNAEQAAMTNSTVVTPNLRTERPTSSDSEMTSSLTNKIPRDSMPPKNAEAQSEEKGFIIVVVLPFLVLFLLFILTVAVLIYYVCRGKKAKYEIQEKRHPSHTSSNSRF